MVVIDRGRSAGEFSTKDITLNELLEKMYKVVIEEKVIEEKTFYRVRVGPFSTEGIATNTMTTMKNRLNLKDPFVIKKDS